MRWFTHWQRVNFQIQTKYFGAIILDCVKSMAWKQYIEQTNTNGSNDSSSSSREQHQFDGKIGKFLCRLYFLRWTDDMPLSMELFLPSHLHTKQIRWHCAYAELKLCRAKVTSCWLQPLKINIFNSIIIFVKPNHWDSCCPFCSLLYGIGISLSLSPRCWSFVCLSATLNIYNTFMRSNQYNTFRIHTFFCFSDKLWYRGGSRNLTRVAQVTQIESKDDEKKKTFLIPSVTKLRGQATIDKQKII